MLKTIRRLSGLGKEVNMDEKKIKKEFNNRISRGEFLKTIGAGVLLAGFGSFLLLSE